MAFPTQSVSTVVANQTSAVLAQLVTAMNATTLPLDPSILNLLAVTMTSDNTASVGTTSVRTLTVRLDTPPLLNTPYNITATAGNGAFSMFSTSPLDAPGEAGVGAVTVTYADANTTLVNMNGTTPVAFNNANHGIITSYTFGAVGTLQANAGLIVIVGPALVGQNGTKPVLDARSTLGPKGRNYNNTPRNYTPVVATIPACFYTIYPTLGQQAPPFLHWIYNQEQQQVGGIIYTNPVLT